MSDDSKLESVRNTLIRMHKSASGDLLEAQVKLNLIDELLIELSEIEKRVKPS